MGEVSGVSGVPYSSLRAGRSQSKVSSNGNSPSGKGTKEDEVVLGNPSGEGCGVADRPFGGVRCGPPAARLTHERVDLDV